MKIKYTGTKQKMTVTLPVGFGKHAQTSIKHFAPNQIHEFDAVDGERLLRLNQQFGYFVEVEEAKVEPVKVEQPVDLGAAGLVAEEVKEEAGQDDKRGRGRPKKESNWR